MCVCVCARARPRVCERLLVCFFPAKVSTDIKLMASAGMDRPALPGNKPLKEADPTMRLCWAASFHLVLAWISSSHV